MIFLQTFSSLLFLLLVELKSEMKFELSFIVILTLVGQILCFNQANQVSQSNSRFIASVRFRRDDQISFGRGFLCVATLITNREVLTTASCVDNFSAPELTVALGSNDLTRRNLVVDVSRITIHQNYTQNEILNNNIAVLRLSSSVRYNNRRRYNRNRNSHIQPIALSNSNPSSNCQFFAWSNGNILRRASLATTGGNNCGNSTNGVFCAGAVDSMASATILGGPLVCNNRISGFAIDNVGAGRPAFGQFHSVSHHHHWIRQVSDANVGRKHSLILILIVTLYQICDMN